jgi:hypothetical protein
MLGLNSDISKAHAVNQCPGSLFLHCNGMILSPNGLSPAFGIDHQICDSSFSDSTCNLDKYPASNVRLFIISTTNIDQQYTGGSLAVAIFKTTSLQFISHNDTKKNHFYLSKDTIPIYLQNLSLIC